MSPLASLGGATTLLGRTARNCWREGLSGREALTQLDEIGVRSAWLVASGMAFFGVVMVTIAHAQAMRFVGSLAVVGPAYFERLVREVGPATSALLVAARAAALASAELGSMTVNEQVEALEMSAGDPLADLVGPRLLASLLAVPALCVVGTMAATLSAMATASWVFGSDGFAFCDPRFVTRGDLACGLVKGVLCGVYIPVAAAFRGLSARGGSAAVGSAVTRGVVDACLGCLVIDFGVAVAFLLLGQ